MAENRSVGRRSILRRSLLFLGGAVGLGIAGGSVGVGPTVAADVLRVRGVNWQLTSPERRRGVVPEAGQRSIAFGELVHQATGEKLGEFYAASFQFGAPFGASDVAAAAMETHQFNLADGTIIGVGTVADLYGSLSVHAIIGGTGRYEGASGSYTARQRPIELGGDGTADFEFNIIARSV
jgi:hypothetical protein